MIEIHLHGRLRDLVDTALLPLRFAVRSPGEAYLALRSQVPGFEAALREGNWQYLIDDKEPLTQDDVGLLLPDGASLHIYPVAEGDGFIIDFFVGIFSFLGSLFYPSIKDYNRDAADELASYLFDGPVNTRAQGGPVPMVFGRVKTGSYTVSAGVSSARLTPPRAYLPTELENSPAEFENTLQTGATIRVVDLLSEGPIKGLVGGARGVFLDGVPVQDAEGNETAAVGGAAPEAAAIRLGPYGVYVGNAAATDKPPGNTNLKGVKIDFRPGTADQAPLDGIPAIENERVVDRQVTAAVAVVERITAAGTDTARVTLRFPRLSHTNDDGDTMAAQVRFAIDVQAAGEAEYATMLQQTLHDKNISPAEISYDIPLAGAAPWNIRVRRITADSGSDRTHNQTWWARLAEIQEIRQTYPHSAVVSIVAEAERFTGDIQRREYLVDGMLVPVPSNYDPVTRTYTGVWDGLFKGEPPGGDPAQIEPAWTDNGAWIFYYLLINRRFGLGADIEDEYLSAAKWALYTIARFNDEEVTYNRSAGTGGYVQDGFEFTEPASEPRFTFNGVIQKAADAKKLLDNMLSNFHSAMYYGGGAVVAVQDAPAEPEALLTNANVEDGDFHYADMPLSERVSVVNVSFNDPDDDYRLSIEQIIDNDLIARYGYKKKDIVAMFCTSRGQAHRFGRLLLFEQEHESDTVSARTGMDAASLRPGAVARVADRLVSSARTGLRVVSWDAGARNLVLDNMDSLRDAARDGWTANVVKADGAIARVAVTDFQAAANQVTLADAIDPAPVAGAVAVLERGDAQARQFRTLAVRELDGDELGYELALRAYHPGKYDAVEDSEPIVTPNYRLDIAQRYRALAAPAAVALTLGEYADGGTNRESLIVSVQAAEPDAAFIDYGLRGPFEDGREADARWTPVGRVAARALDVPGLFRPGRYRARARTLNSRLTAYSPWTESAVVEAAGPAADIDAGADGPPGLPGASKLLPYSVINAAWFAGQYKFSNHNLVSATGVTRLDRVKAAPWLLVNMSDATNADQSAYYDQVEPGDIVVRYESETFWLAWQVTSKAKDGAVYIFGIAYLFGVEDPAPASLASGAVTLRWSRAEGREGRDGAPARPATLVNLVYDDPRALGADVRGDGQYRFGSTDGSKVYATPEDIAQDGIRLSVSGVAADGLNRDDTYFRDIEPGDTAVLYKDLWWIAWRITGISGPGDSGWDLDLALLGSHGAPDMALAGVEVRIGFDRTPSAFTEAVEDGTLALDSAANRHVLIYPGDGYLRVFWDINSGSRELDSDVYARGAQLRYRKKGETDWTLHRPDDPERWPPETLIGLENGATYEVEVKLAYRVAPTYALVFGDVFIAEGTPAAASVEVLAEYEVTVESWADDDGSDSFTGYFPSYDFGAPSGPPQSSRVYGSLKVVTAHPDYNPVGAIVFTRERIGRESEQTVLDFLFGAPGRGQGVNVPNDPSAFVTLQLVGFENLALLRTAASYRQGAYGGAQGGFTAFSWAVDEAPWSENQTHRVRLLRTPAPDIGPVRQYAALPGDGKALLSWAAPLNSTEAGLTAFRVRRRVRGAGSAPWVTVADDITGTSYTITGLNNSTVYDIAVDALGINGYGAAAEEIVIVRPTVIGRYWLDSDGFDVGNQGGIGWYGPRPDRATFSHDYTVTQTWANQAGGMALELPEPIARRYSIASSGALAGDYNPAESRALRFYQFAEWQDGQPGGDEFLRVSVYAPYLRRDRTPFVRTRDNIWEMMGLTRITARRGENAVITYPVPGAAEDAVFSSPSTQLQLKWTTYDRSLPRANRNRYGTITGVGEVEFIR